ncbi:L domain-like protein [Backusella circina FSU 941]|nr:L domain-like protein [Backusella circina FSU 941]
MGQSGSKSNEKFTFGYVNSGLSEGNQTVDSIQNTADFVLSNPHLYSLEFTCAYCSDSKTQFVVAEKVNLTCPECKRNKRMSLVQRNLQNDLDYIDETYYPDRSSPSADNDVVGIKQGLSALTEAQISGTRPKRFVNPSYNVNLSGKALVKLSPSITRLQNITKLDLSNNEMVTIPKELGELKNLELFNASKNKLESIPDNITGLIKLRAINLSENRLKELPRTIGELPSLIIIVVNSNQLTSLPREIAHLTGLLTLNISQNPLKSIPAEIATLKSLRKLISDDCEFESEDRIHSLKHDPPSLFEQCARIVVRTDMQLSPTIPRHIQRYFTTCQTCSFCHGPFFESHVTRSRLIERTGRQIIALDYQLCSAHWTDEKDRITCMFSSSYQPENRKRALVQQEESPQEKAGLLEGDEFPIMMKKFNSILSLNSSSASSLRPNEEEGESTSFIRKSDIWRQQRQQQNAESFV